jgi:hypothetical protein
MLRLGASSTLLFAPPSLAQPAEPSKVPEHTAAPASGSADEQTPVQVEPSSDELAPPDEFPSAVAPPATEVVVVRTPPRSRVLPIRAVRRLALLGELGWNGLAGLGPILTYHASPHVSFDLGAGLALVGFKAGLRGRYNILSGPLTPFLGLGYMGASGWGEAALDFTDPDTKDKLNIKVYPSAFMQVVAGFDWTTQGGFSLLGSFGYAWLLSRNNAEIVTGEPTPKQREDLRAVFGSGAVISLAGGYSFK